MPFKSPYLDNDNDWSPSFELGFAGPGPKDVFVYVLKVRTANVYKIGISNDLTKRIPALERETGYSLEVYGTSAFLHRFQARALEAVLHSIFFSQRIHGEFFELKRRSLIDGLIELGDFGFGSPEQYLSGLLPRYAGIGDAGGRMRVGYVRLKSIREFPALQKRVERLGIHRCYVDYRSDRKKWQTTRMDVRSGDLFYLLRDRRTSCYDVSEIDGRICLSRIDGDVDAHSPNTP